MNKRSTKKLTVRRETTRVLAGAQLERATGGRAPLTVVMTGCDPTQMPPCLSKDPGCHSEQWCTYSDAC
jgi:hypothetical protein